MPLVRSFHAVMTLSGSAEALSVGGTSGRVRWCALQPGTANANPVFIGGSTVSSTDYGTRLPPASGGVPPPPHVIGEFDDGTVNLADIYVIGNAGEKLHIHALVYTGRIGGGAQSLV